MFLKCLYFLLMEEPDISCVLNFIFLLMLPFEKALQFEKSPYFAPADSVTYILYQLISALNWSNVYTECSQPRVLCFSGCIIHQMDISEMYCASVTANLSNFSLEFEIELDGLLRCLSAGRAAALCDAWGIKTKFSKSAGKYSKKEVRFAGKHTLKAFRQTSFSPWHCFSVYTNCWAGLKATLSS